MGQELARIIHLTDMHLHVDERGNYAPPAQRATLVRLSQQIASKWPPARGLIGGFNTHSASALAALISTLDGVVAAPATSPLTMVQSGDLEAYGPYSDAQRTDHFRGYEYWRSVRTRWPQVDRFIDVYGNHDIWPGTLPAAALGSLARVEKAIRKEPEFRASLPDLDATLPNDRVEFYRVNTVQSGWLQNTLATGCIETDWTIRNAAPPHYPVSQSSCPFDELLAVAHQATNPALPAIRILVMHHPPHFFNATGTPSDLKAGALNNASDLGVALAKSPARFHLVLAGHRHELNPAIGVRLTHSLASGGWQKPLPPTVVQLVAGSPTQLAQGTDRPSFSVYRLEVDANQLAVERTVYYLQSDLDTAFTILCCEKTVSCLPV